MKDKHEIRRVDFMLRVQEELVRSPTNPLPAQARTQPDQPLVPARVRTQPADPTPRHSFVFFLFFFCLFLFLDQRLPGSVAVLGAAGVKRLQAHVEIIVRGLPDDLRRSLEAQAQAQAQATQEASAS